jgi:hypothetical protein
MQNLQTNSEALLQHFQVEELEERLENKWGGRDRGTRCPSHPQDGADNGGDCEEQLA